MSLIFEALKGAGTGKTSVASAPEPRLVPEAAQPLQAAVVPQGARWSGLAVATAIGMLIAGGGTWLFQAGRDSTPARAPAPLASQIASNTVANTIATPIANTPAPAIAAPTSNAVAPAALPAPSVAVAPQAAPAPAPAPAPVAAVVPAVVPVVTPAPLPAVSPAPPTAAEAAPVIAQPAPKAVTRAPLRAPVLAAETVATPRAAKPLAIAAAAAPPSAAPAAKAPAPVAKASAPAAAASAASAEPAEPKPAPRPPINTQVQLTAEAQPFDVRDAFQGFVRQVQMGQLADAQRSADQITKVLGSNHVVSLRAQGYLALKKDELSQAKAHYLKLHQMLPDDREAGLNLSLIEWRMGERDSAAERLGRLVEKFPNDPEIRSLQQNVRSP